VTVNPDELIQAHPYTIGPVFDCNWTERGMLCGRPSSEHADPRGGPAHLIDSHPHTYIEGPVAESGCDFRYDLGGTRVCGYPRAEHARRRPIDVGAVVRLADKQQYARTPMPDAARRGPVVTLIDAPTDPLGTLAVLCGIYTGQVRRSKAEVSDTDRRAALEDMQKTVLSGPLECVQFTFLIEGVDRAFTHQMVRNRFSFFAQESLRFAVAEDWAQEVPLPPALLGRRDDDPAVMVWRRGLNAAEDTYAALVAAGLPAEEARGMLPHAITTRLFWTVSLRTLLQEAGKRTCTQAQFIWRQVFGQVAQALRNRGANYAGMRYDCAQADGTVLELSDAWQYREFARLLRPACYQTGGCAFKAQFDRSCSIRERVDAFERLGVSSEVWHSKDVWADGAIDPAEWLTDPGAARVVE
jgi:flavin-dependent thymidylate synthase